VQVVYQHRLTPSLAHQDQIQFLVQSHLLVVEVEEGILLVLQIIQMVLQEVLVEVALDLMLTLILELEEQEILHL
jgi:hypothetical protein